MTDKDTNRNAGEPEGGWRGHEGGDPGQWQEQISDDGPEFGQGVARDDPAATEQFSGPRPKLNDPSAGRNSPFTARERA